MGQATARGLWLRQLTPVTIRHDAAHAAFGWGERLCPSGRVRRASAAHQPPAAAPGSCTAPRASLRSPCVVAFAWGSRIPGSINILPCVPIVCRVCILHRLLRRKLLRESDRFMQACSVSISIWLMVHGRLFCTRFSPNGEVLREKNRSRQDDTQWFSWRSRSSQGGTLARTDKSILRNAH